MPAQKKDININLIISKDLGSDFSGILLSWVLTYGRYIIIVTQIIVLSVFFLRFKLDRDHTDLKEAVEQKRSIIEAASELESEIRHVQSKLTNIKQTISYQDQHLKLLDFFLENFPVNITLTILVISEKQVSFKATAGTLTSFSFLLSRLQADERFSEVSLEDIRRQPNGGVDFKIRANINLKEFGTKI